MKYRINIIDKLEEILLSEKFDKVMTLIFFWLPFNIVTIAMCQWTKEMLQLTNVFFAVMIAAGAICFTYSRALDNEDKNTIRMIVSCGERFLLAALIFIFSSGFKYFVLITENPISNTVKISRNISIGISLAFTFYASFLCLIAASKLITHLKRRIYSHKFPNSY